MGEQMAATSKNLTAVPTIEGMSNTANDMLTDRLVLALVLLLALSSTTAHAFWDLPYVTPANPTAGATVTVTTRIGRCDTITAWPGYPVVTREGNAIRVLYFGAHFDSTEWCILPVETVADPIGVFAPGDYTLTVDLSYIDPVDQIFTLRLGVIPFTVRGIMRPAVPAPTMNASGLLALMLMLSGMAIWAQLPGKKLAERRSFVASARCPASSSSRCHSATPGWRNR